MRLSLHEEKFEHSALTDEQTTFKDLSFKDKISYIWDYFKWWIIGFGAIVITLIITVPGIVENSKDVQLYALFINSNIKGQEYTTIMDDYVEAADIDMDNKRITLDTSLYIDRETSTTAGMQNNQKLTALFASKTVDVILSDEKNFEFCCSQGAYMDLKELLPADLYEKYSENIVMAENPHTGEMTAYGIRLADNDILITNNAFNFNPIISVCTTTEKKDNAIAFIKYLTNEL